jgi:hypothetical protein
MPANPGGVTSTLVDGNGNPIFVIYEFFDPPRMPLRDRTVTTSTGTKTGALIVDNMTGKTQKVVVTNPDTGTVKTFNIPTSGSVLTAAQLAALPAPNGPVAT